MISPDEIGGGQRSGAEALPKHGHATRRARTGLESFLALAMLGYGQGLETLPEATRGHQKERYSRRHAPDWSGAREAWRRCRRHAGSAFILCKMTMKNRKNVKNYWVIPILRGKSLRFTQIWVNPCKNGMKKLKNTI